MKTVVTSQELKATNTSLHNIMPYVREIAAQNDDVILSELGLAIRKNGSIQCKCPIHNGDNPTGFSYKSSDKIWKCWTHHCHEKYGSDVIGLVMGVRGCTLRQAVEFILDLSQNIEVNGSPEVKQFIRRNHKNETIFFDESFFDDKNRATPYLIGRGYSQSVIDAFRGFTFKNREYLPIITDSDQILGFAGRLTVPDEAKPKWKLYPEQLEKNNTLFGINLTKLLLAEKKEAILVEGPLDVINLYEKGVKHAVGVLGTSISQEQIKLLIKWKVKKIIIAFDPDSAGIAAAKTLEKRLSLYFYVTNITEKLPKDPGDLNKNEVEVYFAN